MSITPVGAPFIYDPARFSNSRYYTYDRQKPMVSISGRQGPYNEISDRAVMHGRNAGNNFAHYQQDAFIPSPEVHNEELERKRQQADKLFESFMQAPQGEEKTKIFQESQALNNLVMSEEEQHTKQLEQRKVFEAERGNFMNDPFKLKFSYTCNPFVSGYARATVASAFEEIGDTPIQVGEIQNPLDSHKLTTAALDRGDGKYGIKENAAVFIIKDMLSHRKPGQKFADLFKDSQADTLQPISRKKARAKKKLLQGSMTKDGYNQFYAFLREDNVQFTKGIIKQVIERFNLERVEREFFENAGNLIKK